MWQKRLALGIGIFGNLWIWRIFNLNPVVALLLVGATLAFYKNFKIIFLILFAGTLFFQFKTTNIQDLTHLTNDQQRVVQIRLKAYPYWATSIGKWLEVSPKAIALGRIRQNFFENLDINQYFFATHPRQRVGITEFEKFPYILLPFFIYGTYKSVKQKPWHTVGLALTPLALLAVIGNQNPLGPFSLLPIFAISTIVGLEAFLKWAKKPYVVTFLILFGLVMIQIISYENF
ncbi:hypothetical protein A2630_01855 [Candidatus Woesebacteria bacterium RIFCSPHIGHO2_01_FULL_44_10]|uniref:Glycosyltransferase RgtA/B/C/D-like domain-containing protein n=1 Tax=Candidatus Woesebacteria bacterium RIFCSPLOWO2_01_FULL_44_14 TaxID=1802525 RepID=A0A1F8C2A8_9BACT|nr:MAG: hypothetical protein A2630_01855 [Candidatus Woesebacteria bacterium RIFCSPHIGHO2_01_FULL_44_10]OGM54001.1 MAG: hypothetical protein A3F62_00330 [Candidatus Woesebacteria bacterium RIFCSPHIGHO2_12_FULL_44_11]OGM69969.1 MAG: hypothetical protein A2975_05170 [Candidatus Woesebacteria bacterium RIFCSPLOWO2_01_FULL_44_14]